jgi:alpha-galactosidase
VKSYYRWAASLVLVACSWLHANAQTTLAATPPMGWNSWNWFAGRVTDKDIRQAADLLVSSGMRDAGYVYVNIDDTWEGTRDSTGVLHTNTKFPDMKALADYVHGKGLKLGIYSSPGPTTCAGFAGSYGHEQQDADMYAAWGVDYLKYDMCGLLDVMRKAAPNDQPKQYVIMRDAYEKMHQALLNTKRPILYSLCQYGFDTVWHWGPSVGAQAWRTQGDIEPTIESISSIGRAQAGLAPFAGPGHWNDPDMLEVGNGKLTPQQNRLHMALWAMLAAPLIAGNNLTEMSASTKAVLMDKDLIALDQDPLGKQADRIYAEGPVEVWSRPLADGSTAVALFNFRDSTVLLHDFSVAFHQLPQAPRQIVELGTTRTFVSLQDMLLEPFPPFGVRIVRMR